MIAPNEREAPVFAKLAFYTLRKPTAQRFGGAERGIPNIFGLSAEDELLSDLIRDFWHSTLMLLRVARRPLAA